MLPDGQNQRWLSDIRLFSCYAIHPILILFLIRQPVNPYKIRVQPITLHPVPEVKKAILLMHRLPSYRSSRQHMIQRSLIWPT